MIRGSEQIWQTLVLRARDRRQRVASGRVERLELQGLSASPRCVCKNDGLFYRWRLNADPNAESVKMTRAASERGNPSRP